LPADLGMAIMASWGPYGPRRLLHAFTRSRLEATVSKTFAEVGLEVGDGELIHQ